MNKLDLKSAILIIKDCEEVKSRIDKLIAFGNELSASGLNDEFGFNMTKPKKGNVKINDDDYGISPLRGLSSWIIDIGESEPKPKNETIISESLSVQESLIIVNHLVILNRQKLKVNIDKLKELGINI